MTKNVPLEEIGFDPKFYPRVNGKEDWLTVHRYTDFLLSDPAADFPPVVLVRVVGKSYKYLMLDGKHRQSGYHGANRTTIPAVIESLPQSKWFARSVELNSAHGRTLDTGDKAFIAVRLEADGYSVADAARLLHMRVESLEKIKIGAIQKLKASGTKAIPIGRGNREVDGKHYGFVKAPFKDFTGSATAEDALQAQGPLASANVLQILDSCIAVLKCGVNMADADVAVRVAQIKGLLP